MVEAPLSNIAFIVADRLRPMRVTGRFKCTRKSLLIVDKKWIHDDGAETSDSRTANRLKDRRGATLLDGLIKNPREGLSPAPCPYLTPSTPTSLGSHSLLEVLQSTGQLSHY